MPRSLILSASLALISVAASAQDAQLTPQLKIDLSKPTGPILHGASGWLYGQSAPGIPAVTMMEPLKPQISAQKPANGLQHPGGDANLVAPDYRAAGGKQIQVYMQDMYPDWTYNNLGIDDYLQKVDAMTRDILRDPNHDILVYVPFNEPNNNWYADTGDKFLKFLVDWNLVYHKIRSIDRKAIIAGPGFEHWNAQAYETFLTFARDNHTLPDQFTWHELHDDFYPNWYARVDTYRAIEKKLGIAPMPIVINEYVRQRGDLHVPGNLVQWIARLEDSKAYGCLAFWSPPGTLADLTARIWPNRPNGAWWLFQWYGSMTGNTLAVTPPDRNTPGLQGVATFDPASQQLRAIFGGTAQPIGLKLTGLQSQVAFKAGIHIDLYRTASSDIEPAPMPELVNSTNFSIAGPDFTIPIPAAPASSAYYLILTPTQTATAAPGQQLAIEADLTGKPTLLYSNAKGPSVSLNKAGTGLRFLTSVDHDGYYLVRLHYATTAAKTIHLAWNQDPIRNLDLNPTSPTSWGDKAVKLFLQAGVNSFRWTNTSAAPIDIRSLEVTPTDGPIATYQPATSTDSIQFNAVNAPRAGRYRMLVTYSNNEKGHKGQVDQPASISVNSLPPTTTYLRNTFSDTVTATTLVDITLKAGDNTIRISNPAGPVLHIDHIQIAAEEQPLLN